MIWIAVFVANAVVLVLEIVGARSLTPFFGSSAEAWAGIIGIVLLGLAIGYWGGGILADRSSNPLTNKKILSSILAAAGVVIIATWSGGDTIAALTSLLIGIIGLTGATAVAALALLFFPSILLAASSPLAVKVLLTSLDSSAQTVGRVSAVAAAGSVVGSLGVGMVLVPWFGSFSILMGAGVAVLAAAVVLAVEAKNNQVILACIAAALIAGAANYFFTAPVSAFVNGTLVADVDTRYNRIFVMDVSLPEGGVFVRSVHTDPFGTQCGALMRDQTSEPLDILPFPYTRAFDVVFAVTPSPARMLVVGGCNYSYPIHAKKRSPETLIDVVEIDEGMTKVAREWFNFVPENYTTPIHADGRLFLENATSEQKYDVVVIDAYNSLLSVPFQLLTQEAFASLKRTLAPQGVVAFNIVGSVNGPGTEYTASILRTLGTSFPHIRVYQLDNNQSDAIQNLLVLASENELDLATNTLRLMQHNLSLVPVSLERFDKNALLLTDDYAPIERLTKPMRDSALYR